MGLGRIELPTSSLSGMRSNRLSYSPGLPGSAKLVAALGARASPNGAAERGSSSSTVTRTPPVRSLIRLKSSASTTAAGGAGQHEHDAAERERLEDLLVLELEAALEPLALGALAVLVGERRAPRPPAGAWWSCRPPRLAPVVDGRRRRRRGGRSMASQFPKPPFVGDEALDVVDGPRAAGAVPEHRRRHADDQEDRRGRTAPRPSAPTTARRGARCGGPCGPAPRPLRAARRGSRGGSGRRAASRPGAAARLGSRGGRCSARRGAALDRRLGHHGRARRSRWARRAPGWSGDIRASVGQALPALRSTRGQRLVACALASAAGVAERDDHPHVGARRPPRHQLGAVGRRPPPGPPPRPRRRRPGPPRRPRCGRRPAAGAACASGTRASSDHHRHAPARPAPAAPPGPRLVSTSCVAPRPPPIRARRRPAAAGTGEVGGDGSGGVVVAGEDRGHRRHGLAVVEVHHPHAGGVAALRGDLAHRHADERADRS